MRFRPDCDEMIWDWAFEYFMGAHERCLSPGSGCRYLRADGHRCVIGSMFEFQYPTDEIFMLKYFGPVRELFPAFVPYVPSIKWATNPKTIGLLTEIQVLHDSSDSWGPYGTTPDLIQGMFRVADRYNLPTDYANRFMQ